MLNFALLFFGDMNDIYKVSVLAVLITQAFTVFVHVRIRTLLLSFTLGWRAGAGRTRLISRYE